MGADFYNVLNMIHDRLKCNAVPIQLPIGTEDDFRGIIDLVEMRCRHGPATTRWARTMRVEEIPADMMEQAEEYRTKLVEPAPRPNDEIMEKSLEGRAAHSPRIRSARPSVRPPSTT